MKKIYYNKFKKKKIYQQIKNKFIIVTITMIIIIIIINISFKSSEKVRLITDEANIIRQGFYGGKGAISPNSRLLCNLMLLQLGKPYLYGSTGPDSFDCSGLTKFLYSKIAICLPRIVSEQSNVGKPVDRCNLEFGDIIFFSDDGLSLTHEGIYIGNGYFIHAPKTGDVVKVSTISSGYYAKIYQMSIRVLP